MNLLGLGILRAQGGTRGGKEVGVFRFNGGFLRQLQGPDEGLFQFRQEMQGAAQKGHLAPDGFAAGQARNGLVHHGLENGGCQVSAAGALVDQGLNVGFGKDAAAGGDGVNLLIIGRLGVEPGSVSL